MIALPASQFDSEEDVLSSTQHQLSANNSQYFENLENKLLQKSDKITNIIGFNYVNKFLRDKSVCSVRPSEELPHRIKTHKYSTNLSLYTHSKLPLASDRLSVEKRSAHNRKRLQTFQKVQSVQGSNHQRSKRTVIYSQDIYQGSDTKETLSFKKKKKEMSLENAYSMKLLNCRYKETMSTQSSIHALQFPDTIHIRDFSLLRNLGKGKFGDVFMAQHKATNFLCAIKKTQKRLLNEKSLNQIHRQLKIQTFLNHPNIVQMYKFFVDQNYIYLILQLCYSGHLYDNLKQLGTISQSSVRNIMKQVCNAVQYLHDKDIIHRDLKPENILMHEGVVKICDFGWSICSPLMRETFCGTPLYVSPELLQKKSYDNKIDIWGIGILTYELLFGKVPFEIRFQEDLFKIVQDQIYFPEDEVNISSQAKDFIMQCLNKQPTKRSSIAKLLDHPFICQNITTPQSNRNTI